LALVFVLRRRFIHPFLHTLPLGAGLSHFLNVDIKIAVVIAQTLLETGVNFPAIPASFQDKPLAAFPAKNRYFNPRHLFLQIKKSKEIR
jgi:hypothetical protein